MHQGGQREIDRSGWPPGPWDGEPDRWEARHAGFPVLAVRNELGNWCGYVGVPPGHPWRGGNNDDLDNVRVHGGITYASPCQGAICHVPAPGEPDDVLWIGFDCAHAYDLVPGMLQFQRGGHAGDVYRSLAYVQEQTRALADQAAAAAAG